MLSNMLLRKIAISISENKIKNYFITFKEYGWDLRQECKTSHFLEKKKRVS